MKFLLLSAKPCQVNDPDRVKTPQNYAAIPALVFMKAQFSNAVLSSQAIQYDTDLLLGRIVFAGCTFDAFDDLLARTFARASCLSHLPLLSG